MTAVGKILVFLNLVFAFVVGAFAVMNYTARTYWADEHLKLKKSYEVVKASAEATKKENDKLVKDREAFNDSVRQNAKREGVLGDKVDPVKAAESLVALAARQKADIKDLKDALEEERKQKDNLQSKLTKAETAATTALEEARTRQQTEENLRGVLAKEVDRNTKLTAGINYMRDKRVAAEIEAKSLKEKNVAMAEQLAEMGKRLTQLTAQGARPAAGPQGGNAARNPPPEHVEGRIQRVDGDLVTLSIGSDAGLQRGHTMYVFDLNGNGTYRGQIVLKEVTPKTAVGQVTGKQASRIKVGDTASSAIMQR